MRDARARCLREPINRLRYFRRPGKQAFNAANTRHILRTGLIPFATNLGLAFPFLVSGALVTETIFSWPGVGRLTVIAINSLDYPVLMGILTIGAAAVAIGNLISDVLYAFLDPRVRL